MELFDVVMKLVGPVDAVGETYGDKRRLENLKKLTVLVDKLLLEINEAAQDYEREEASVRAIGQYARSFLVDVHDSLD